MAYTPAKLSDLCRLDAQAFVAAVVYRREEALESANSSLLLPERGSEQDSAVQVAAGVVDQPGGREEREGLEVGQEEGEGLSRWTCKSCASVFLSLEQQRSHFKSDFHRLNVSRGVGQIFLIRSTCLIFSSLQHDDKLCDKQ